MNLGIPSEVEIQIICTCPKALGRPQELKITHLHLESSRRTPNNKLSLVFASTLSDDHEVCRVASFHESIFVEHQRFVGSHSWKDGEDSGTRIAQAGRSKLTVRLDTSLDVRSFRNVVPPARINASGQLTREVAIRRGIEN